jgi:hypothetical protein
MVPEKWQFLFSYFITDTHNEIYTVFLSVQHFMGALVWVTNPPAVKGAVDYVPETFFASFSSGGYNCPL